MAQITDDELLESTLAGQIEEAPKTVEPAEAPIEHPVEEVQVAEAPQKKTNAASQYLGQSLNHKPGENPFVDKDADQKMVEEKHLSRIGDKIGENTDVRDGWIDVPRELLGDRAVFYPESWRIKIHAATVEAIRQWSTIDDENINSIDEVFNEIMKSCVKITDSLTGNPISWKKICSWDRIFFLLLVREYSFEKGESKAEFEEECPECGEMIKFSLTSQNLVYELPDDDVMKMYDPETRTWHIDPYEYDVDHEPITLYIPTLEKDANIKQWMMSLLQENRNRKIDQVFVKFLFWMAESVSTDQTRARKQIREIENIFKSWDADMFGFMDEVLKNIAVQPETKMTSTCERCGEELTADIRFPVKIRDLFAVQSRRKKFGSK